MQITEIYYQRNFQVGEFLYEHYGVKIGINGTEDIDQAFTEAERIVKQQHYIKNKDNTFYANAEQTELPVTQEKEQSRWYYPVATDDDVVKEIQSYKLGINAFVAVYGDMVKGNSKLEEAYKNKISELTK